MVDIDGSYLEGGGQILRTAVALSALTRHACRIYNIRKSRPNPGLQAQHLEAINATAKLCNAAVRGNALGSKEIVFFPREIKSENIEIDIPTAGSIGLVLQPIMIAALQAGNPISIEIRGGATNGKWAPPLNYVKYVMLPLLEKFGYGADIDIKKYGYYPKGGAHATARINPSELEPVILTEPGQLTRIKGISHASKQLEKAKVAERQARAAEDVLKQLGVNTSISVSYVDTANPGCALELFAMTENSIFGSDGLGELKKRAEDVGKEAAQKLVSQIKMLAAVDEYAEDQLLPYMALAAESGESSLRVPKITDHTKTNIWVIEKFLPVKFDVDEDEKIISCNIK